MRVWAVIMAVAFIPWAAIPVAADSPPHCEPATCDPEAANEGEVRSGDEPVRVILYAHPNGILQHTPLNTDPPTYEEEDVNQGFLMPTVYTDEDWSPCCKFRNNRFIWFSSPGLVEYEDGQMRVHQQPGFGAPLEIAGEEITVFLYLSPGQATPAGPAPAAMPSVGVYGRLVEGRHPTSNASALIAEGDTGTGYDDPQSKNLGRTTMMVSAPGEDPVYEFRVPLKVAKDYVPGIFDPASDRPGMTLELLVYQLEDDGTVRFTQSDWRLRSGPDHPPRIVFDVARPLRTADTWIHTANGDLYLRWAIQGVFGTYDIDASSLHLDVDGPIPIDAEFVKLSYSVDHDGHFKPANATWRVDLGEEPVADGTYWVHASVKNLQGTYKVQWNASFEVKEGWPQVEDVRGTLLKGSANSPGVDAGLSLLAGIVGLAAAVAWRRRV